MLGEERRRRGARAYVGVGDEPAEEREVRRHAVDIRLCERSGEGVERLVTRRVRARPASRSAGRRRSPPRLPPRPPRRLEPPQRAEGRVIVPVSGRNVHGFSAYNRASTACPAGSHGAPRRRRSPDAMRICSRDEVETPHCLRDRVLHLDAAVELEEEERAAVDDELHRPGARVADRLREARRRRRGMRAHASRRARVRRGDSSSTFWWRRCTEQSRSPSATTRAVRVREQLHLDVARPLEVALAVERPVAEGGDRLALGRRQRLVELGAVSGRRASRARLRPQRP